MSNQSINTDSQSTSPAFPGLPNSATAEDLTKLITASMLELAGVATKDDLYKARMAIEKHARALDSLDFLRSSAESFQSLFTQLPWLENVEVHLAYSTEVDGRPYKNIDLNVMRMQVNHLAAQGPAIMNDELEEALQYPELKSRIENFTPPPAFNVDMICLYECLDPDETYLGDPVTIAVSREQVVGDFEIDAIAEDLFPEKWAQMAKTLDLPYSPSEQRSAISPRP